MIYCNQFTVIYQQFTVKYHWFTVELHSSWFREVYSCKVWRQGISSNHKSWQSKHMLQYRLINSGLICNIWLAVLLHVLNFSHSTHQQQAMKISWSTILHHSIVSSQTNWLHIIFLPMVTTSTRGEAILWIQTNCCKINILIADGAGSDPCQLAQYRAHSHPLIVDREGTHYPLTCSWKTAALNTFPSFLQAHLTHLTRMMLVRAQWVGSVRVLAQQNQS